MGPFSLQAFDAHGIVPLGYAAFGFTLGVTAGLLFRRALPAMAVTLAIFAAVQVAMPLAIRPNLFPPAHTTQSLAENISGGQSVAPGGAALVRRLERVCAPRADRGRGRPETGIHLGRSVLNPC